MRRAVAAAAASSVAFFANPDAMACPCQGSSGPVGAVTSQTDRIGVSVTETARVVHGAWRSNGDYAPLAAGNRQWSLDFTGAVGYRPIPVVELGAETAFGRQSASSPDYASSQTGFGDMTFRVRWDAVDEPMSYEKTTLPWPSLTVVGSVRAPTASLGRDASGVFSGTTGSVGSSASSEGLGTWETGAAAALVRAVAERFQFSLIGEAAYRFPDTSLGLERHLAPRFFGQLGARYMPTPTTGIGLLTDLGAEGNVVLEGIERPATNQRLWSVGAFGYLRTGSTGLGCGALIRYSPAIDDISRNATRATSLSLSLGYLR